MKRSVLILLLFGITHAKAQQLNLKKGQQMTYEILSVTDFGTNQFANFSEVGLLVKSATKDGYVIQVSRPRIISADDRFFVDSKENLMDIPAKPLAVGSKIRTLYSYEVIIDRDGKVKEMSGTEKIRDSALATIKRLGAQDSRLSGDYLDYEFGEDNFKYAVQRLLAPKPLKSRDTIMNGRRRFVTQRYIDGAFKKDSVFTIDSMYVRENMGREAKTGLLISLLDDSSSHSVDIKTGEKSFVRYLRQVSLRSSNIKALGFGPQLYNAFREMTDYDLYSSPEGLAARKVNAMYEYFQETKGKPGVKDSILAVLREMDKDRSNNDFTYMMAKAQLVGSLGISSDELIKAIPYERLSSAFYVMNKLKKELAENNSTNLNKAIELCFSKFSKGRNYPLNLHVLDGALHDHWAKFALNTSDPVRLQTMLSAINSTEALGHTYFNQMISGLKTYILVKLADNRSLSALLSANKGGAFDRYGRYRLLVFDELTKRKVADSTRLNYLELTIDLLKHQLADPGKYFMEKRPLTRKYLADACYRKSLFDAAGSLRYLQLAADYMPSQEDKKGDYWEVEREYAYLPAIDYNQLFIERAEKSGGSKDELLEKFADLVIIEPERYAVLKDRYKKAFPTGDFRTWFDKTLKKKLPASPDFSLSETSGRRTEYAQHKRKFLFIDFWGTWCGACVNEIHKIEALHVGNDIPDKLMVTTIACFDKPGYVDEFMAKRKYSYQVLMSDNQVERKFMVSHYPTKLLLLPNGTYVTIPNSENYRAVIDTYMKWEL